MTATRCCAFVFLAVFLMPALAQAQAWPRPSGTAFVAVDFLRSDTGDRWDLEGEAQPLVAGGEPRAYRNRTIGLRAELGLTDAVTLSLWLPYRRIHVQDAALGYRVGGQGDAEVGARIGIPEWLGRTGPHGLTAAFNARLPMGYTRNLRPSAGTGQIDLEAGLTYGYRFGTRGITAEAGGGFRRRTAWYALSRVDLCTEAPPLGCFADRQSDFDDELYAHTSVGGAVSSLVNAHLMADVLWSIRTPERMFEASFPYPRRQRRIQVGGALHVRPFERLLLGLDVRATPWGRNALRATDWRFRIGYDV